MKTYESEKRNCKIYIYIYIYIYGIIPNYYFSSRFPNTALCALFLSPVSFAGPSQFITLTIFDEILITKLLVM